MRTIKLIASLLLVVSFNLNARENPSKGERVAQQNSNSYNSMGQRVASNCSAPKSSKELWVNNVRTIIFTGGDMWWDLFGTQNAYYYIPAVTNKAVGVSSMFAGSIWIGGTDNGGQLKVAAMTYRQNGIDYWPGPLNMSTADVDAATCLKYDQLYPMTRSEVDNYINNGSTNPSQNMINWPGNGDPTLNQDPYLAPFVDVNGDGIYDPTTGDYPAYDVKNTAQKDALGFCKTKLFGDYTLFWVFNDKGNIHTETQGFPIGIEVRAQAFGFKTNDDINNMTFYTYEVHNRSSFQLNNTYFTIWGDCDLGYYLDDYVGSDIGRGMAYQYNANPYDPTAAGVNGYLNFPPAIGCDFFKGPMADPIDPVTGAINPPGTTLQMSRSTYYNNNIGAFPPQTTNPDIAIHYYNYMTGFWKDGSSFTRGGTGYGGTQPTQFVFDGDPVAGTGWTEKNAGNLPGDRRFLLSAGPFTLKPGSVNSITYGMPWGQSPNSGGNIESISLLRNADDKAQALFDNCFKLLDGPEAPDLTVQELDKQLIVYMSYKKGSNNYNQYINDYYQKDISIPKDSTSPVPALRNPNQYYSFEGYIVYQVVNNLVTAQDLYDGTKAIPVFQCDVKNGVSRLVNYNTDPSTGALMPQVMVEGADQGISTSFKVTVDAFAQGSDKSLTNNKTYYFIAIAYAYNNYLPYAQDVSPQTNPAANYLGQKRPFLSGRLIKKAAGVPAPYVMEYNGTTAQSNFGFGPKITRLEGQGNGGNLLTLTRQSENDILQNNFKAQITYENGQGPLGIHVVDPLNVINSNFQFRFIKSTLSNPAGLVQIPDSNALPTFTLFNSLNPIPTSNQPVYINYSVVTTGSASTSGTLFTMGYTGDLNMQTTSWELTDLNSGKKYYPNTPTNATLAVGNATNSSGIIMDNKFQTISVGNEFFIPGLGFSINVKQVGDPGEQPNQKITNFGATQSPFNGADPSNFIGASINYENGVSNWMQFITDADGSTPRNWILSGTNAGSNQIPFTTNYFYGADVYYGLQNKGGGVYAPYTFADPNKVFGNILNGAWAPYPLVASYYTLTPSPASNYNARVFGGPGFNAGVWVNDVVDPTATPPNASMNLNQAFYGGQNNINQSQPGFSGGNLGINTELRRVGSVLIVFTKDQSKWTRCPVIEMQERRMLSKGNAPFFTLRNDTSVDKNGIRYGTPGCNNVDAAITSTTGMGWFPGYAISLESGERLNMMFGEDSYQRDNNGDDMMWNPTSNIGMPGYPSSSYAYAAGGKHFVYVFGANSVQGTFSGIGSPPWTSLIGANAYIPRYDSARTAYSFLSAIVNGLSSTVNCFTGTKRAPLHALERDLWWVSIPFPKQGYGFKNPANMPSDVRIQINVSKPYRYGYSGYVQNSTPIGLFSVNQLNTQIYPYNSVLTQTNLTKYVNPTPVNNNFPLYTFNTNDIATLYNQIASAKSALDNIRVVPNPYYGASAYELNRIDNRVKITNLPDVCTIKIFSLNGTLVRMIKRDATGQENQFMGNTGSGNDIKQHIRSNSVDWDLKNQSNITVASGLYIFHIDAPGLGEKVVKWFGVIRPLDVQNY
ncbi:MAG: hypothetical protein JSU07_02655 [Bacteroidetes bacterium]|nr:hypothetical protein [Bacteroidota bacterium]